MSEGEPDEDLQVAKLRRLFAEHPAWRAAAAQLDARATSTVRFSHLPGRVFHLAREGETTVLQPGVAPDPDFEFRFTPEAVDRLGAAGDRVGDFAVTLMELLVEPRPEARVELRIVASFGRLARRGYVALLLYAGPRLLAFGAERGIRTPGDLARLVRSLRRRG